MNVLIDRFINLFKWPVAVYMVILLPGIFSSVDFFNFKTSRFLFFGGGLAVFAFSKTVGDAALRVHLQTLIHELTHSFWALLTFHKVKQIKLNDDISGGGMVFQGEGNWLIVIAPYFFPLVCFFYMIFMWLWLKFWPYHFILTAVFGYLVGLHLDTVCSQIHEKQTDLPKVSYPFCWAFLPGANLLVIGSLFAYNSLGWHGIKMYFLLVNQLTIQNFVNLFQAMINLLQ